MLYFETLPKVITTDQNGNYILMTNLLTRAKLQEELQNNPMLFYTYAIQDGDTPEIIADKYYNDPFSYWVIMYSNQLLDPIWSWPLSYQQFLEFIDSKYAVEAEAEDKTPFEYVNTTVYAYQKITETTDGLTGNVNKQTTTISLEEYNSLVPSTQTVSLPNGTTCTIKIDKTLITIYDYEFNLNEEKRNIKILNGVYLKQFEKAFFDVMRG